MLALFGVYKLIEGDAAFEGVTLTRAFVVAVASAYHIEAWSRLKRHMHEMPHMRLI